MTQERGLSSHPLRLTEGVVRAAGQELDTIDIDDFGNALSDIEQHKKAVGAIEKFNLWELKVATDTLLTLDPRGERYKALVDLLKAKLQEAVKLVPSNGENSNLIPKEFLVKDFLKAHGLHVVPGNCYPQDMTSLDEAQTKLDKYGLVDISTRALEKRFLFHRIQVSQVTRRAIGTLCFSERGLDTGTWKIVVFGRGNLQPLAMLGREIGNEFGVAVTVELEDEQEYVNRDTFYPIYLGIFKDSFERYRR